MSQFTIVALSEAALLIIVGIVLILWIIWQRKKHQSTQLESLLQEIQSSEVDRGQKLIRHLTTKRKLGVVEATELSQQLQLAEKQFFQFYVQYQFAQGSGAEFYAQLTELLDKYLKLIPLELTSSAQTSQAVNFAKTENPPQEIQANAVGSVIPAVAMLDDPEASMETDPELYLSPEVLHEVSSAGVAQATVDEVNSVTKASSAHDGENATATSQEDTVVDFGGDADWGAAFKEAEAGHAEMNIEAVDNNQASEAIVLPTDPLAVDDEFGNDDLDWGAAFKEAEAGHAVADK